MKAVLCLIVALGYLAYTAFAMPTNNDKEDDIGLDIDPILLIQFLGATEPRLALKVLEKMLEISHVQNPSGQSSKGISLKVDRNLFLAFLEATNPQLALKALPKILGKNNIHLMRRDLFNEHEMFNSHHDEHSKEKIFRLY